MHRLVKLGVVATFAALVSMPAFAQETGSVLEPAVIAEITDASTVNFVNAAGLSAGDPMKASRALNLISDKQGDLHAEISANAALKAKVEAAGYTVDDVVYVKDDGGGMFTAYVK